MPTPAPPPRGRSGRRPRCPGTPVAGPDDKPHRTAAPATDPRDDRPAPHTPAAGRGDSHDTDAPTTDPGWPPHRPGLLGRPRRPPHHPEHPCGRPRTMTAPPTPPQRAQTAARYPAAPRQAAAATARPRHPRRKARRQSHRPRGGPPKRPGAVPLPRRGDRVGHRPAPPAVAIRRASPRCVRASRTGSSASAACWPRSAGRSPPRLGAARPRRVTRAAALRYGRRRSGR